MFDISLCRSLRHLMVSIFAVLAIVIGLSTQATSQDAEQWYIAVAGPMTGADASLGQAMLDAVSMRIDEVNDAGGVLERQVSVLVFDDENSPERAAEIAAEIGDDPRVLAVIGHRTSGASIAAGLVYATKEIPAITGTATADEVTVSPWYFRTTYNNGLQAEFIASYMNSVLGFEQATLITTDTAYSDSLASAFVNATARLPLEVTNQFYVVSDNPDIDLDMADIVAELSLKPDSGIVFLAMSARDAAFFVREMRNSGFTLPIFGPDSINQQFPDFFEEDQILKLRPGDFSDQIYATTSMIWDVAGEDAVRFRSDFRKRFGDVPNSGHALYYDSATFVLNAMSAAGLAGTDIAADRTALRDALAAVNSPDLAVQAITGDIYLNAAGDAVKTVPVGIFELGEFISAPVQFAPVDNPTIVPDFSDKLEAGSIVPFGSRYMHKTQIVYLGVDINEIGNLDTSSGTYVVDFYIWLRYKGDLDISKIQFSNATTPLILDQPIWKRERNGMNIVTYKVRHSFLGSFEFTDYPFDRQKLSIEVRHSDRVSESLKFVTDRLGMRLDGGEASLLQRITDDDVFHSAKGWDVSGARVFQDVVRSASTLGETRSIQGETEVNFSRIVLEIDILRKITSYATTIMLPMVILFVIGLLLFAVPVSEIPPRLSGGILVLVTVSLLRARLSNDLPNIGYLVAIDYIFFALQIILWFGIAISVGSFWLWESGRIQQARLLNLAGALAYPLPIIAVGVYIALTTQVHLSF